MPKFTCPRKKYYFIKIFKVLENKFDMNVNYGNVPQNSEHYYMASTNTVK